MINEAYPEYLSTAETILLNQCLFDRSEYETVQATVRADDFYTYRNQCLWRAIEAIYAEDLEVSPTSLERQLRADGTFQEVSWDYLIGLMTEPPRLTYPNAANEAKIVKDESNRRKLRARASEIARLTAGKRVDMAEVRTEVSQILSEIETGDAAATHEPTFLYDAVSTYYDRTIRRANKEEEPGIPTGWCDFDNFFGGLHRGGLIIVAARPGVGKSDWLINLATNVAKSDKTVLFFTLEMNQDEVVNRMMAAATMIENTRLNNGQLTDQNWGAFTQASGRLADMRVAIDDQPDLTPLLMREKLTRFQRHSSIDLVCVDYLQLMAGDGRFEKREQEVAYISRQLKLIAKSINAPVVCAAQLSREIERRAGNKPQLSDLRESGAQEQDADMVVFPWRPIMYEPSADPRAAKVIVAKNRHGQRGEIDLMYFAEYSRFANADRVNLNGE